METGVRVLLRAAIALACCLVPARAGADEPLARYDALLARWDEAGLVESAAQSGTPGYRELSAAAAAFLAGEAGAPALAGAAVEAAGEETRGRAEWLRDTVASWHALLGGFAARTASERVRILLPPSHRAWGDKVAPHIVSIVEPVLDLFGAPKGRPVDVVFLENVEQLSVVSRVPSARLERSGTVGTTAFHRIFLLSPASYPDGYAWHVVLGHEAVHYALQRRVPGAVPHFFEEGLASLFEDWGRTGKPKGLLPLERALLQLAEDRNLYLERDALESPYWQIEGGILTRLAFVQARLAAGLLLQKDPVESLRQLLDGLAAGTPFQDVARTLTGASAEAFQIRVRARWRVEASRENLLTFLYDSGTEWLPDKSQKAADESASLLMMGDLLWGRGRTAAALSVYLRLPEELQLTPEAAWRICRLLVDLGRIEESKNRIQGPLALFPLDSRVLHAAALVYGAAGDTEQAQHLEQEAWLVNPFAKETADAIMAQPETPGEARWEK